MSNFKRIPVIIDAATGKQIDEFGSVVRDNDFFRLLFDETVILCCQFYDVYWIEGEAQLSVHPINPDLTLAAFGDNDFDYLTPFMFLSEQTEDEDNTVNIANDWINDATADPAIGQLSFRIDTNTTRFAEALSSSGLQNFYFCITGIPSGQTAKTVLAYFRFKAENRPSSSAGAPVSGDPEYLNSLEIQALVKSAPDFQFSVDGATDWHDTQVATDRYYREQRNGGEWSAAIALIEPADAFVYVAYASDNSGTDFNLTSSDTLKYRAEIHVTEEIATPAASDFSGATWVKYIGNDGATGPAGADGTDGADGQSFTVDASGLLSEISTYDAELEGFAFLATDTGDIYIKNSDTSGDWSDAIPFQGPQGPQGETGPQGEQGIQGDTGAQGEQGIQGIQGEIGPQGAQGIQGETGSQGPQGETGPAGEDGTSITVKGSDTYSNIIAKTGAAAGDLWISTTTNTDPVVAVGDGFVSDGADNWTNIGAIQGPQGPQGIQGETGAQGPQGIQGETGPQGDTGETGAAGSDGTDTYTYVAYASDNSGTGWSLTPSDSLKYRAEIHSATALTPVESDFSAATWVKYIGNDASITNLSKAATELTISSGAVTKTQLSHTIDGESDADDDLDTINGGTNGDFLLIFPENAARNITIKHGTGNIITGDGEDFTIPDDGMVWLYYDGTNWRITAGASTSSGGSASNTVVTITASGDWTVPAGVTNLKHVWLIAGGGGGGSTRGAGGGGGGGAGGVKHLTNFPVTPSDLLPAIIGAGGSGITQQTPSLPGVSGGDTTFLGFTVTGGGGGGSGNDTNNGLNGGSGGGAGWTSSPGTGVAASVIGAEYVNGQGSNGGTTSGVNGAGGGGYSGVGSTGNTTSDGGLPLDLSMYIGTGYGVSGKFAGGGGGGGAPGSATGGGGDGGIGATNANDGIANTGGGGGGGGSTGNSGAGGSGIIIIIY